MLLIIYFFFKDNNQNKRSFEKIGKLRASYPFGIYTNYALMMRYMRTLDFYYPHIVKLISIGKTHEGRLIEGLKVIIINLNLFIII